MIRFRTVNKGSCATECTVWYVGCLEATAPLKEGVDRLLGHDKGRGEHLPVPCLGRAKGALFSLSLKTMKASKEGGQETGDRKRGKKTEGKKT